MLDSGLKTKLLDPLPPQRMPSRVTFVPLVMAKTGEPLSPEPTVALTKSWHSWVMLVPLTLVLAHTSVTAPCDQPVVRPTLFTVWPVASPSSVMENSPVIVRLRPGR